MEDKKNSPLLSGDLKREIKQLEFYHHPMVIRLKNFTSTIMLEKIPEFFAPREIMGMSVQSVTSPHSFGEMVSRIMMIVPKKKQKNFLLVGDIFLRYWFEASKQRELRCGHMEKLHTKLFLDMFLTKIMATLPILRRVQILC